MRKPQGPMRPSPNNRDREAEALIEVVETYTLTVEERRSVGTLKSYVFGGKELTEKQIALLRHVIAEADRREGGSKKPKQWF